MKRAIVILLFLLLQAGCAVPNSPGDPDGGLPARMETLFPHPDDWADAPSHGPRAIQFGNDLCLDCHPDVTMPHEEMEEDEVCYDCHDMDG